MGRADKLQSQSRDRQTAGRLSCLCFRDANLHEQVGPAGRIGNAGQDCGSAEARSNPGAFMGRAEGTGGFKRWLH